MNNPRLTSKPPQVQTECSQRFQINKSGCGQSIDSLVKNPSYPRIHQFIMMKSITTVFLILLACLLLLGQPTDSTRASSSLNVGQGTPNLVGSQMISQNFDINREECQSKLCLRCSHSPSTCDKCIDGYFVNETRECSQCTVQHCKECLNTSSVAECSSCDKGYYLNPGLTCSECSVQKCAQCIDGSSESICRYCDDGYYVNSVSGNCEPCSFENCLNCQNRMPNPKCIRCVDSYYVHYDDFACQLCSVENCLMCSSLTEFPFCSECQPGYYHNRGQCSLCNIDNCEQCYTNQMPARCMKCIDGYYTTLDSKCSPIPIDNCAYCYDASEGQTICVACLQGFHSNKQGNKCIKCSVEHCSTCSAYVDENICVGCDPGYFFNSRKECQACTIEHCRNCKNQITAPECGWCEGGYFISSKGMCFECTFENCLSCQDYKNTAVCSACREGYYLNEKRQCAECSTPHCSACRDSVTEPWCWYCVPGYYAKDGKCIKDTRDISEVCLRYSELNEKECLQCADGYVHNEQGQCAPSRIVQQQ